MRLLFFAEAVTLAHVARPIALASGLVAAGHVIAIACAASHSRFASACGLPFSEKDNTTLSSPSRSTVTEPPSVSRPNNNSSANALRMLS